MFMIYLDLNLYKVYKLIWLIKSIRIIKTSYWIQFDRMIKGEIDDLRSRRSDFIAQYVASTLYWPKCSHEAPIIDNNAIQWFMHEREKWIKEGRDQYSLNQDSQDMKSLKRKNNIKRYKGKNLKYRRPSQDFITNEFDQDSYLFSAT